METDEAGGRMACSPRGEPGPEPFPPVAVAVVKGKVAAFSAFAERVGVGLVVVPKRADEAELRARAARLAVADALRVSGDDLAVQPGGRPGLMLVTHAGRRLRVQTARHKDVVVATTVCESE
jgi:hypothetical protein